MCVCVGGCVCVNLRRVHGVGEDGADRSVSWRQTGIFSGMLVFLCHLGGTWYGQYETLERLLSRSLSLSLAQTRTHARARATHKGQDSSKVFDYYPRIRAIRKGQSLFLSPSLATIL